jgi:hypothetical protein
MSDQQFLDIATQHFPRWREDIQEAFVVQLGRHIERELRSGVEMADQFGFTAEQYRARLLCESQDTDALLRLLKLDPESYRTEAGYVSMAKVRAAIKHPDEYPHLREKE